MSIFLNMMIFQVIALLILHTAAGRTTTVQCTEVALRAWCTSDLTESLVEIYYQCENDFSLQEKRCRTNERGILCGLFVNYLKDLKQANLICSNQSHCSSQCQQLLEQLKENLGCCFNEMINITSGPRLYRNIVKYELWKNCSLDPPPKTCQSSPLATFSNPQVTTQQCSSSEFYRKRYQVQCSNTKIKALADTYDRQNCSNVSEDLYNTCTTTSEDMWCIEKFSQTIPTIRQHLQSVQSQCSSHKCSSSCQNALRQLKAKLGCCASSIFNNSFFKLIYSDFAYIEALVTKSEVWSKCGLPHSETCRIKMYSGSESSLHVTTFALIIVFVTFEQLIIIF